MSSDVGSRIEASAGPYRALGSTIEEELPVTRLPSSLTLTSQTWKPYLLDAARVRALNVGRG